MDLFNTSKHEILQYLKNLFEKDESLSHNDAYILGQILYYVESKVIQNIRDRQSKIENLKISGHGCVAVWGDKLTPGCKACLDGSGLWTIRATQRCNLSCNFCYYKGINLPELLPDHFNIANRTKYFTTNDIKIIIDKQGVNLNGIAWVSHEPFVNINKHLDLIRYISKKGIHQWMYTNGTLIKEDDLRILQDCGLNELRFNLHATNCSSEVIKKMKIARKYFKYICIESPMTPEFFLKFKEKRKEIIDTEFDQINCAELHLSSNNSTYFDNESLYCFKYGYISPISSRHATYDLIELAEKENWNSLSINDCSNEAKFYRGIRRDLYFGEVDYSNEYELDPSWYLEAIEKYRIYKK